MKHMFVFAMLLAALCCLGAVAQDSANVKPADPAAAAPAPANQEKSTVTLQNDVDTVSYAIGVQIGKSIKGGGLEVNPDIVMAALGDVFKDRALAMTDQQMMEAQMKLRDQMQAKRAESKKADDEKRKVEGDKNIKVAEDFLAENGKKDGVKTTASGLQYQILTEGTGASPKADDEVTVHYKGTLLDGTVFDSSYDRKEPATFTVKQLIPGWVEALQLMKEGGKYKLFIHPKLAYADRGAGQIPPNSALIFEMELLKIKTGSPSVEIKTPAPAAGK
jgi:FKBP-type peptidyl-prolyl cis-trans isomerase